MSHVKNVQREAEVQLPRAGEKYVSDDGTVSQVLEDVVDAHYEPTPEEVKEYAEWIGMKLPEDAEFLWIAREGLKTALPKEWKPCRTDEGEVYYFNFKNGDSSWEHPMDKVFRGKLEKERAAASAALGVKASASLSSSHLTFMETGVTKGGNGAAVSRSRMTTATGSGGSAATIPQAQPERIMSEAERALEDRIRAEVKAEWEKERIEAETLNQCKLDSLQKLHEQDLKEAEAAAAKVKEETAARVEGVRRARLQEARQRCDDTYRTELNSLEREAAELTTQRDRLVAERGRSSGNEKVAAEKKAAEELDTAIRSVEEEALTRKSIQLKELEAQFTRQQATLENETHEALAKVQEEADKTRTQREVAVSMSLETRRKKLEDEKSALERELFSLTAASVASPTDSAVATPSVEQVRQQTRTELTTLQSTFAEEVEKATSTHEAALQALSAKPQLSTTALAANGSGGCADGKPSGSGPSTPTAANAALLAQRMTALRARHTKEKQEALGALRRDREAQLSSAKSSFATPLNASGSATSFFVQSLRAANVAAQEAKTAHYKAIQETLATALAAELESLDKVPQEALIAKAVEAEMEIYVKEVESRRERIQMEFDHKAEKAVADHAIAMTAYERRVEEHKRRQAEEVAEMQTAMLEDAVQEALQKEREALRASAAEVVARRTSSYADEERALKAEVDEEMEAYERAELKKLQAAATAATATASAKATAKAEAAAADDARAVANAKGSVAALKESLAQQQVTHRAELDAVRVALQQKQLEEQSTRAELATAAAAAAFTPSTTAATPPPPAQLAAAVVRKVAPQDSTLRTTHRARYGAAEDGYRSQEAALREELSSWKAKNGALTSTPLSATAATSGAVHRQVQQTSSTPSATVPRAHSPPVAPVAASAYDTPVQALSPRDFRTDDAVKLLREQQRRQQAALAAREEYRQWSSQLHMAPPEVSQFNTSAAYEVVEAPIAHKELTGIITALHRRLEHLTSQVQRVHAAPTANLQVSKASYANPNSLETRQDSTAITAEKRVRGTDMDSKWQRILSQLGSGVGDDDD